MKKILLIQLPLPQFQMKKHWGNVPLTAGRLKAAYSHFGLLEELGVEILENRIANFATDQELIEAICEKSPDFIGLSLYCCNSVRSLDIAEEVKKRLGRVKIIVGGPEARKDMAYLA